MSTKYTVNEITAILIDNGIVTGDKYIVDIVGNWVWVYGVYREDETTRKLLSSLGFHFKMKYHEEMGNVPAWYYPQNYKRIPTDATAWQQNKRYGRIAV